MRINRYIFIFLFTLLNASVTFASEQNLSLPSTSIKTFYDISRQNLSELSIADNNRKNTKAATLLFEKIKTKKGIFGHRLHWINTPVFSEKEKHDYLNLAEQVAKRYNDKENRAWVFLTKSMVFQRSQSYQESIKNAIVARDLYTAINDSVGRSMVCFMYGTLYEAAHLFEKAKECYSKSNSLLSQDNEFTNERQFINQVHLGSIATKQSQHKEAINYFSTAIDKHLKHIPLTQQATAFSYANAMMANSYIKTDEIEKANRHLDLAFDMVKNDISVLQTIYLHIKSELDLHKGNYADAKSNALKSYRLNKQNPVNSHSQLSETLKVLATSYQAQNMYDSAYIYLNEHVELQDSLKQEASAIKSVILIANSEYVASNKLASDLRKKVKIYVGVLTFLFMSLSTFALLYFKLKRANQKLVDKAIAQTSQLLVKKQNMINACDDDKAFDLAVKLEELFITKKLYLEDNLTLIELANQLSTNTSYLSKSINCVFQMNLNTFINLYKVHHSIDLITKGMASTLTIEAIATESGFNNRTVFNSAFKRVTGVTPSFFIKRYKATQTPK